MATSKLTVEMTAKSTDAARGIKNVKNEAKELDKTIEQTSGSFDKASKSAIDFVAAAAAVTAGVAATVSIAKELVTVYSEQAREEAKLQAVLKSTKNAVGMTFEEMKKLAEQMQRVTTFADEEILATERIYAVTKKVGAEMMPRATKAALDMAAALGDDATGAANDLAKALADPVGEMESLKEKNIFLSEEQKKNIEVLIEQNDLLSAQSEILNAVEEAYGGTAEAIAQVDTGKLEKIGNVFNDIKEGLGESLINSLSPVLDAIYEKLVLIDSWIESHNDKISLIDVAASGGDLSEYSGQEIKEAMEKAGAWMSTGNNPNVMAKGRNAYNALFAEYMRRLKPETSSAAALASSNDSSFLVAEKQALKAQKKSSFDFSSFNLVKPGFSLPEINTENLPVYDKLAVAEDVNNKLAEHAKSRSDFIYSNKSFSVGAQIQSITEDISTAQGFLADPNITEAQAAQLEEIIAGLEKEKELLEDIGNQSKSVTEIFSEISGQISLWGNAGLDLLGSSLGLYEQILQNQIDALDSALQEAEERYDEYFSNIDGKYQKQGEALEKYYATGLISAEDYISASEALIKEEQEARDDAQKEMASLAEESNKLKEKQFNAEKINAIAQATISGALAVSDIWAKHGANPVVAGILTGLAVTASAAQIATIASQKFTPMATGGIVTGPTKALIGEAGPEMILPINDHNMERLGFDSSASGGAIYITINVENSYSSDDLSEKVFYAIEKAQRAGALPSWRYA